jgi:hypothetical protein
MRTQPRGNDTMVEGINGVVYQHKAVFAGLEEGDAELLELTSDVFSGTPEAFCDGIRTTMGGK